MHAKNTFVVLGCLAGLGLGAPVMADSQAEQWKKENTSRQQTHGLKQPSHRAPVDQRTQYRVAPSRPGALRVSEERGHRSPGDNNRGDQEQRRVPQPSDGATPTPRRERREDRGPDHSRAPDRGDHRNPGNSHAEPRPHKRDRDHDHDHDHDYHPAPRHEQPHEHRHWTYDPPRHDHRHPRPKYRLYNRHKHIYYRSPWYNTWFLAPIIWHYYRIGYTLEVLPSPYIRIFVDGTPYFYASGTFYRPRGAGYVVVSAPVGAVVTTLPAGYIAFYLESSTYYFANDAYYVWDEPRDGFVVVSKPDGSEQAMEKATQGRLYAYPNKGQSEEQQAKDRYECHLWAVSESDVDPTREEQDYSVNEKREYKRAMAACLEGRGYTVK